MGYILKRNSTTRSLLFFMAATSDHATGVTGIVPTVVIRKNTGGFGSPAGAVSEVGHGFYEVAGNATDRDTLGTISLYATGTGADPAHEVYNVVAYDQDDSGSLGLTAVKSALNSSQAFVNVLATGTTAVPVDMLNLGASAVTYVGCTISLGGALAQIVTGLANGEVTTSPELGSNSGQAWTVYREFTPPVSATADATAANQATIIKILQANTRK